MTRIAIADDHVLVRRGLAELLREMDDFRVVGEASSGDELLRLLLEARCQRARTVLGKLISDCWQRCGGIACGVQIAIVSLAAVRH